MSRRKVTVAFQEVESAASRVVGQLSSPTFADGDLRGRRPAGPPTAMRRHSSGADYWQRIPAPPA